MPPILAETDVPTATIFTVGTFAAPPALVWRALAERELIERWYGPADAPVSFESHLLEPGARSLYRVTAEDGTVSRGFLQIMTVEPERRLVFTDGHCSGTGDFGQEFLHASFELEPADDGTRVSVTQRFADRGDMEQLMLNQLEELVSTLS